MAKHQTITLLFSFFGPPPPSLYLHPGSSLSSFGRSLPFSFPVNLEMPVKGQETSSLTTSSFLLLFLRNVRYNPDVEKSMHLRGMRRKHQVRNTRKQTRGQKLMVNIRPLLAHTQIPIRWFFFYFKTALFFLHSYMSLCLITLNTY